MTRGKRGQPESWRRHIITNPMRRCARFARYQARRRARYAHYRAEPLLLRAAGPYGGPASMPPAVMVGVYRQRNGSVMQCLASQAVDIGWRVNLWALDECVPQLQRHTRGFGVGGRTELLQRLISQSLPAAEEWIIIVDDDVQFVSGDLGTFTAFAVAASLDISQPAHVVGSNASFTFNRRNLTCYARLTRSVEIGPCVALSPVAQRNMLPLPVDFGMGWGLAVLWGALPIRAGVVDAVRIRHLGAVGFEYDTSETSDEYQRLQRLLAPTGARTMGEFHGTLCRWRRWQRKPPWVDS